MHLSFLVQIAGGLQLVTAVANFFLPRSDVIIHHIHLRVLNPIKNLSEQGSTP